MTALHPQPQGTHWGDVSQACGPAHSTVPALASGFHDVSPLLKMSPGVMLGERRSGLCAIITTHCKPMIISK